MSRRQPVETGGVKSTTGRHATITHRSRSRCYIRRMQEVEGRGQPKSTAPPSTRRRPGRAPLTPPAVPLTPSAALLVAPISTDIPFEPPPSSSGSILEQHRPAPPVHITHEVSITGATAELLWNAYDKNFQPLSSLAILQHHYSRDEVLAELANPRIAKIVGWELGLPVGLAMVTNSLDDVPQISPDFLRAKYPEHAANGTIFFGILVMVSPGRRGLTLFSRLSLELWQIPARAGGVLVYDVCDFNRVTFDAETLSQRIADNFPESSVTILDRQTWYVAELPKPFPESPRG